MGRPATLEMIPDWPACLSTDEAVAYTRLSAAEITRHARDGRLAFKALGVNGSKVVPRQQLDELLKFLWSDRAGTPLEDMDFGDH